MVVINERATQYVVSRARFEDFETVTKRIRRSKPQYSIPDSSSGGQHLWSRDGRLRLARVRIGNGEAGETTTLSDLSTAIAQPAWRVLLLGAGPFQHSIGQVL